LVYAAVQRVLFDRSRPGCDPFPRLKMPSSEVRSSVTTISKKSGKQRW
jgi:hypothetical protein